MLSGAGAANGGTSPPIARPQPPSAPFARRTTRRQTTDALLRGVGWGEATNVLMGSLGAPTVEGPTGRGLMPVSIRGTSAGSPGGGDLPPPHGGSEEGLKPLPRLPIWRLRLPRRERCRAKQRSRWRRGKDRPRPPRRWRQGSRGAEGVLSCPFLSLLLCWRGGVCVSSYLLSGGFWGEGDLGYLTMTAQAGPRWEKASLEKPAVAPRGAAARPLP